MKIPAINPVVYFGHPIDLAPENDHIRQFNQTLAQEMAAQIGPVFRPSECWTFDLALGDTMIGNRGLQRINDAALRSCNLVVIHLPDDTPTIGTILEIRLAGSLGIPCVVVAGSHLYSCSVALHHLVADFPSVRVLRGDQDFVVTTDQVLNWYTEYTKRREEEVDRAIQRVRTFYNDEAMSDEEGEGD